MRSAESSASSPGMLSLTMGSIVPSLGLTANSTVHLNPWWRDRIRAIRGIDSSDLYDSSPVMKTMCFPLPGPSPPG